MPFGVYDLLLLIVILLGSSIWYNYAYGKALDKSYETFKDGDYKQYARLDIPEKYREPFIEHQKSKGNLWLVDFADNMTVLFVKNESYNKPI